MSFLNTNSFQFSLNHRYINHNLWTLQDSKDHLSNLQELMKQNNFHQRVCVHQLHKQELSKVKEKTIQIISLKRIDASFFQNQLIFSFFYHQFFCFFRSFLKKQEIEILNCRNEEPNNSSLFQSQFRERTVGGRCVEEYKEFSYLLVASLTMLRQVLQLSKRKLSLGLLLFHRLLWLLQYPSGNILLPLFDKKVSLKNNISKLYFFPYEIFSYLSSPLFSLWKKQKDLHPSNIAILHQYVRQSIFSIKFFYFFSYICISILLRIKIKFKTVTILIVTRVTKKLGVFPICYSFVFLLDFCWKNPRYLPKTIMGGFLL